MNWVLRLESDIRPLQVDPTKFNLVSPNDLFDKGPEAKGCWGSGFALILYDQRLEARGGGQARSSFEIQKQRTFTPKHKI